jgi:nucleotide-binding universal stress UspA family protein
MKILVAVDGSSASQSALGSLLARLPWFAGTPSLELIHVHPPIPYGAAAAWAGKEAVHRYYEEESDQALAPAKAALQAAGIEPRVVKKVGDPAAEIVKYAEACGHDLIVVGTHGHTALANVVMGSVATKVLAHARLPVLLIR